MAAAKAGDLAGYMGEIDETTSYPRPPASGCRARRGSTSTRSAGVATDTITFEVLPWDPAVARRHDADALHAPGGHGSDAGPELGPRGRWPPTAQPTASGTSSSRRRRSRSWCGVGSPVNPVAIK